ncbi:hypothetical protein E2I00_017043 [Balaenoptera physalus]|uniref:Cadherin domain-containing protein n=1 Tax=Balaenoptera physalus TaxID=9770 RepID=A0A6A1QE30_BALPH|nr:hypothetical protein E2I00_017043 [Balaenoptera physalus]
MAARWHLKFQSYESTAPRLALVIRAEDCGGPPLSSTATVHIRVRDGDNHVPRSAGTVRAAGANAIFSLRRPPLDCETQPVRSLVVAVENEGPLFSCEGGGCRGPAGCGQHHPTLLEPPRHRCPAADGDGDHPALPVRHQRQRARPPPTASIPGGLESAGGKPLPIEAEDGDQEPYSDPFTFKVDNTWGNTEDTWKLGENHGRSVELLMLRSLPRGDYLVPLFIGDKQGLSQKQTVHVRVCSCPGGFTCAEPSVAGAGLLQGVLASLCAAFIALAAALRFLLRCYFVSEARGKDALSHERSYVRDQMSALSINTAEVGAKLGAKVYLDTVVPKGPMEVRVQVMAGMLSQQLGGADIPKGDPGYPPHVYAEEGKCERAETRSSLAFSEHDLSPDLLDSLGPKAAPLEEIYSESGFHFLKTAYFGELE